MSFTTRVRSWFSHRGRALSLYQSGMAKANKHDYNGAIADYSAAIRAPHIPNDVKAMAIYNRALAYSAIHEDARAAEDLAVVLEIFAIPMIHTAWLTATVFSALNVVMLRIRISVEELALSRLTTWTPATHGPAEKRW